MQQIGKRNSEIKSNNIRSESPAPCARGVPRPKFKLNRESGLQLVMKTTWVRPLAAIYNDLPVAYSENVNTVMAPYGPRTAPALNAAEIADVVSFLCTLTDGHDPANPAAYPLPDECRH